MVGTFAFGHLMTHMELLCSLTSHINMNIRVHRAEYLCCNVGVSVCVCQVQHKQWIFQKLLIHIHHLLLATYLLNVTREFFFCCCLIWNSKHSLHLGTTTKAINIECTSNAIPRFQLLSKWLAYEFSKRYIEKLPVNRAKEYRLCKSD